VIRRVSVEKLAPTGEGVARSGEKVGFVAGALPGEDVEAEVSEERRRFWKGQTIRVLSPSPDRVFGPHVGCPGCDWAHLEPAAARAAKRELFIETMERIGRLPRALFGELPITGSPGGYRLRSRFHVACADGVARVGLFAPRTHRVESIAACEAIGPQMRAALPRISAAIESSAVSVREITMVEDLEGCRRLGSFALGPAEGGDLEALEKGLEPLFAGIRIVDAASATLREAGARRLPVRIASRELFVDADAFFQSNRFLVPVLFEEVRKTAANVEAGAALDAYGGVGLFAGALLDAGHHAVTVEESAAAVECAREGSRRWNARGAWEIVRSSVEGFLERSDRRFELAVVDPPRAGMGSRVAHALSTRVSTRVVVVSCDPATLARDLPVFLEKGWLIGAAELYDLFPFTHRVEAIVALSRETP
jgi:tRNA/tmRNA/rRNA uracil-C5-methylase (TrmA/RlmC/RlmD family)